MSRSFLFLQTMIIHKAVFPTAYFGPVEYFAALISTENIIFDAHEHYHKQTLRNRCRINSPNGPLSLSVPVIKTDGNHTPLCNIFTSQVLNWQTIHWRSIEAAYNSSAFFLYYKDDLAYFFKQPVQKLFDLNIQLTLKVLNIVGINLNYSISGSYLKSYSDAIDLREKFGIKGVLPRFTFPEYYQVFENKTGFHSNLSVLDLIFNLGPETLSYLKNIDLSHLLNPVLTI